MVSDRMVSDANLQGFRRDRYFSRSWALLTLQPGWIKPVLLLALGMFVPVVGQLVLLGYALEWARLTAWGVNAAPKQKDANIGACLAAGWRGFLVALVWGLGMSLLEGVLAAIPRVGGALTLVWTIFCIYLELLVLVAMVRSAIYQRVTPGYRADRIWQMGSRDVGGLLRILGVQLAWALIASAVGFVLMVAVAGSMVPTIMPYLPYIDSVDVMPDQVAGEFALMMLGDVLTTLGPWLVVVGYASNVLVVIQHLTTLTCVGLWMRQFDVPRWGRSEDPLPQGVPDAGAEQATPVAPEAQAAPVAPEAQTASSAQTVAETAVGEPVVPETTQEAAPEPAATTAIVPAMPASTTGDKDEPAAAEEPGDSDGLDEAGVAEEKVVSSETLIGERPPAMEAELGPAEPEPAAGEPVVPGPGEPEREPVESEREPVESEHAVQEHVASAPVGDESEPTVPETATPKPAASAPVGDESDAAAELPPVEVAPMEPLAPVVFPEEEPPEANKSNFEDGCNWDKPEM